MSFSPPFSVSLSALSPSSACHLSSVAAGADQSQLEAEEDMGGSWEVEGG